MENLRVRVVALAEGGLPFLLALQAVLGSLQLLDAFRVVYHPMIHGATRVMRFELGFSLAAPLILSMSLWFGIMIWRRHYLVLLFPALAIFVYPFLGLEAFIATASLQAVLVGLWLFRSFGRFFFGVFLLLSGIEGLALLHWVVFIPLGWVSPLGGVAWVEMALFHIAGYLAPLLVLPFLFMWLLKPMIHWGWRRDAQAGLDSSDVERKSWEVVLFLVFTILLGMVSALYPFMSAVNPKNKRVGVDVPRYVEAAELVESDLFQVFNVSRGTRPLLFFTIYGYQCLFGLDVVSAVRFLPVFLNPLLAISIFFLTREMFNDSWVAVWAAFFTVSGFQVTIDMFAYFLANSLGLSIVFFSLGFLFKALRYNSRIYLAFASLLGVMLLLTHPWTFNQYITTTILMVGIFWYNVREKGGDYEKVKILLVYIASLGFVDFIKVLVLRGFGGVSSYTTVMDRISGFPEFWFDSIFSFRLLYGGTLSFVVLLGLAVVGVCLFELGSIPYLYFTVFPAVTSLIFLVGDRGFKGRLLHNVPFGLYAAYGFLWLLKHQRMDELKHSFVSFVFLSMTVYLFRSLANLV